jgi:hypothetical protein
VYTVSEVVDGVSQNYNILLPGTVAVGGTVYLADLAPAAPAGPEYYSLASSLTIGTVTTVATGGSATAEITGLAPTQVLNLGIPTGATGTVASAGSGSVGTAAVAPTGDPNTGIYFPAADQVAVTTGGTQALLLSGGAVSNPTFSGVATFPAGTATAPSITTTGDTNTGVFFPAADSVGIATGGSERVRIQTSEPRLSLDYNATGSQFTGQSDPPLSTITSNTSTLRSHLAIQHFRNTANLSGLVEFVKSRSNATDTNTTLQSNDQIGRIAFSGGDGTGFVLSSEIRSNADTTVSTGDVPGRIGIWTKPVGGSIAERMRVDSNGLITGTGTSLGAWTAYTPTLGGTGWAIGDGTVTARYVQIGKIVHYRVQITAGSTTTFGASTYPTLTLPVTAVSAQDLAQNHRAIFFDASLGKRYFAWAYQTNTTTIRLVTLSADGADTTTTATVPFTWASSDIIIAFGTYEAA